MRAGFASTVRVRPGLKNGDYLRFKYPVIGENPYLYNLVDTIYYFQHKQNKIFMRKSLLNLFIGIVAVTGFAGCGPTAENILKKYNAYAESTLADNQAGIRLETQGLMGINVSYDLPLLGADPGYAETLEGRWFVADAENPGERLPAETGPITMNHSVNGVKQGTTYGHYIKCDGIKARFLLIGFEGIAPEESAEAATMPLFFIVDNGKDTRVLTLQPRVAGDLFSATYQPTRFAPYEGTLIRKDYDGMEREFTVRLGEIGHDESGNLYIDFLSKEAEAGGWVNRDWMPFNHKDLGRIYYYGPMMTEIVVGPKRIRPATNSVADGVGFRETYKTKELPDTVIVRANNYNGSFYYFGEALVFDGKTKQLIRKENE